MKTVIIYVTDSIDIILAKSNTWYVRHYETYFDKVYMVYLRGSSMKPIVQGRSSLISLGTGRSKLDFLLAPFRLYKFARKIKPDVYITWDQIWGWWISWAMQLFLGARFYLMPQFMPEQIYKSTKRSVSIIFPIWLERILIRLSLSLAHKVLTGNCFGSCPDWLRSDPIAGKKTVVAQLLAEALPPPAFLSGLESLAANSHTNRQVNGTFNMIYVGRLQRDKMVGDLIKMMSVIKRLKKESMDFRLLLVGEGPERDHLEKIVDELGVRDLIGFAGQVNNDELPKYLLDSHVYVSPLTGMSLREAALCGLPIVAYDMDWIHGFLKHEETALMIDPGNYEELANQLMRLAEDESLRERLSENIKEMAWRIWSPRHLRESLSQVFEKN